ncbi:hypothetical protein KEM55_001003, partial [Ascosphaera atra]
MAHSRSRSPPVHPDRRRRSPSPYRSSRHEDSYRDRDRDRPRDPERRHKKSTGGFRWKDKRRPEDSERGDERRGGLARGYGEIEREEERDRARRRERRSPSRERYRREERGYRDDRYRDGGRDAKDARDTRRDDEEGRQKKERKEEKKKEKKPSVPQEPMMVVNVNDRLGTKAAIPCFGSDSIRDFKKIVAAQIGRDPHEILIKRQGERPFKDMLTLADYGVSNGVQLD